MGKYMKKLILLTGLLSSLVSLNAVNPVIDPLAIDIVRAVHSGNTMQVADGIRALNAEIEQRTSLLQEAIDVTTSQDAMINTLREQLEAAEYARGQAEGLVVAVVAGAVVAVAVKAARNNGMCIIL
jgi:hypothetical protein